MVSIRLVLNYNVHNLLTHLPTLGHVHLQVHHHIALLRRLAHRKQIAQTLRGALRRSLTAGRRRKHADQKLGRIVRGRTHMSMLREESHRLRRFAHERHPAVGHQQHLLKHGEQLAGRLMYGAHDRGAASRQKLQCTHQLLGAVRIEAGRWLVAEQNRRTRQQLGGERQPFPFATRQNFATGRRVGAADARHRALGQPGAVQQVADQALALSAGGAPIEPEMGHKCEMLAHR